MADGRSLDGLDWVPINHVADGAIDKILAFIEDVGGDPLVFPTSQYFNRRLGAARSRLLWRKRLEGKSPEEAIEILKTASE